jgi:hypothetical protein
MVRKGRNEVTPYTRHDIIEPIPLQGLDSRIGERQRSTMTVGITAIY